LDILINISNTFWLILLYRISIQFIFIDDKVDLMLMVEKVEEVVVSPVTIGSIDHRWVFKVGFPVTGITYVLES